MEVREQATSDDRLLDGEDPGTGDPGVVRRWTAVYAELIAFKQDLISRIELEHRAAAPHASTQIVNPHLPSGEKGVQTSPLAFRAPV